MMESGQQIPTIMPGYSPLENNITFNTKEFRGSKKIKMKKL